MASQTPLFKAHQAVPLDLIYNKDDAGRESGGGCHVTISPLNQMPGKNEKGLNQNKELYSGEPSFSNKFKEVLSNIDRGAPELFRAGSSQHFIYQRRNYDDVKVELEEVPMDLYHYSRYVLEDGSGVQEFLTRIDDEELPSLILPDGGPFGKDSLWTGPLDSLSEKEMIGNIVANIPSKAPMIGKINLPSSSSPEVMEDATIDDHSYCQKRKLVTHLENPFYNSPLSQLAKAEGMDPQNWMETATPFDNSATKKLLQMAQQHKVASIPKENSHPVSKTRKIEAKSVPVKCQVSLSKTPLPKSSMKPKETQKNLCQVESTEQSSEMEQTTTRIYHGPLKSVTNNYPLGHSSLPKKIKETALSISKSKDQWFVVHLKSVPANGMVTVPIPSDLRDQSARIPRSILEKAKSFAVEKKEAITFPICLQIASKSSDPNGIVNSPRPTGLVVLTDPQHPEKVFIGPFPAAFIGPVPSCMVPLNTLSQSDK